MPAPVYCAGVTKTEIEQRMAQQEALALESLRRTGELDAAPTDPVKLAQGTLTTGAPPPPADLDGSIRTALTEQSMDPPALAGVVGVGRREVEAALRRLVNAGHVYNVGSDAMPIYTWRVGGDATSAELRAAVLRLIREREMTLSDLQRATGAPLAHVASVLAAIRRDPEIGPRLLDQSADHTGAWFLPPLDSDPDAWSGTGD